MLINRWRIGKGGAITRRVRQGWYGSGPGYRGRLTSGGRYSYVTCSRIGRIDDSEQSQTRDGAHGRGSDNDATNSYDQEPYPFYRHVMLPFFM